MAVCPRKRSELPLDVFDAVTDILEPFFYVFTAGLDAFAKPFWPRSRTTVRPS